MWAFAEDGWLPSVRIGDHVRGPGHHHRRVPEAAGDGVGARDGAFTRYSDGKFAGRDRTGRTRRTLREPGERSPVQVRCAQSRVQDWRERGAEARGSGRLHPPAPALNEEEDSHDGAGIDEDRFNSCGTPLDNGFGVTGDRASGGAKFPKLFVAIHRSAATGGDRLRENGSAAREIGGAGGGVGLGIIADDDGRPRRLTPATWGKSRARAADTGVAALRRKARRKNFGGN